MFLEVTKSSIYHTIPNKLLKYNRYQKLTKEVSSAYYNGNIPILGLPGCAMYAKRTIFDIVLPRIMADDRISAEELAELGEGGLCLSCPVCSFPNCGFGNI